MQIVKITETVSDDGSIPAMTFSWKGNMVYSFTVDVAKFDDMVEWLFEYVEGRFQILGTDRIYFEDDKDAIMFKVAWQ